MRLKYFLPLFVLISCGPRVPDDYTTSNEQPDIYPDYKEVTVPVNMAPLTFEMDREAESMVARFTAGDEKVLCGGDKIQPGEDDWQRLVAQATGKAIGVEVYARHDGQWTKYKPFNIYVSGDSIDPYLSYRLICPSYVSYEELTINQRCLENYDERVIYDNMLCSMEGEGNGQCINCHNYQQYNPGRMQFHARQHLGGTVIAYDGKIKKVNMRNDSILSAGVYPAWHPWLNLIVYSTNNTSQTFQVTDPNKIEVFDSESDLIAYDVERNEVTNIENDPHELEVFPFWAPDGKTLYYCSAHFEYADSTDHGKDIIKRRKEVKYNQQKVRPGDDDLRRAPSGVRRRRPGHERHPTPRVARRPMAGLHHGQIWCFPYLAPRRRPVGHGSPYEHATPPERGELKRHGELSLMVEQRPLAGVQQPPLRRRVFTPLLRPPRQGWEMGQALRTALQRPRPSPPTDEELQCARIHERCGGN